MSDICEWEGEKRSKLAGWCSLGAGPLFAFAGVWRPTKEAKASAFLTCEPNPLVEPIHAKAMPVTCALRTMMLGSMARSPALARSLSHSRHN